MLEAIPSKSVGEAADVRGPPVGGPLFRDRLLAVFASSSGRVWGVWALVYGVKP